MGDAPRLGAKVKALRRREAITQVELAKRLGISASYLNLIENNRRPLTAQLLIKLAQTFELDLTTFGTAGDSRLGADLLEAFGDPLFESFGLTNADIRELCTAAPNVARAVLDLYRAYVSARESRAELAERFAGAGDDLVGVDTTSLPSEEVSDLIQNAANYFPDLEQGAEKLWRDARLTEDELYQNLVAYLDREHGIQVRIVRVGDERVAMRRYDQERRVICAQRAFPALAHPMRIQENVRGVSFYSPVDKK